MRKLRLIPILFLTLFLVSCEDKQEQEEVIPDAEVTLERSFKYQDNNEEKKVSYGTSANLQNIFVIENEELHVIVASEQEGIVFKIAEEDLLNGYVGTYTLKSLPDPSAGKVYTTYSYNVSATAANMYFSGANTMNGFLEITSYDAKNQRISGRFRFEMSGVTDPTVRNMNHDTARKCDVLLTGTFENGLITIP